MRGSRSKTVYYTMAWKGGGVWQVTFWTKPDKSNALTERFVTVDEQKIRNRIEAVLGMKHFDLVRVKA